ncbi:MAG TPA: hypothetical protein VJ024_00730 [Thermodesulfovibrionales bacterium]|nr:hypothetical protein [Thermodesulfovibrionales bacterium]
MTSNQSIIDMLCAHLSAPFGKTFFETAASILATAIVLFFTLVLIPIQQFVNRYSPSLLGYFKRDRLTILLMTVLLVSFFYQVAMWFFPPIYLTAYISAFLLALSFVLIVLMIFRVIKMMNPSEYLFPRIQDDCNKILKEVKPVELQSPVDKLSQLKDQMKQVLIAGEKVDPNEMKWSVSDAVVKQLMEKMLPLKSIMMNLITTADYELFAKAIGTFQEISISYFVARKEFKSSQDPFQIYLIETLNDLVKTAETSGNVYYTRSLFTAIKEIALSTLSSDVIGSQSGYNYLATPLAGILKERALIDVVKRDMDRAFDATLNYGQIGCALAYGSFGHSAIEIAERLKEIATYCHVFKDTVTLVPVKDSLATIFYNLLRYRKLYVNYDQPYRKMIEIYEAMSNIPTDAGTALSVGDPLFSYEADLFKDRGLSSLVMVGLFASADDDVVYYNLTVVKDIVDFMIKHHDKDHVKGTMFTSMLYQSGLWLFAFIDREIVLEMTLSKQITLPADKSLRKAKKILNELVQYIVNAYFDASDRKKKHIFSHDLQSPALSLLYLLIYLNKKHNLRLTDDIGNLLSGMVGRMSGCKESIDETEHASFEVFCSYLKRMGHTSIAEQVSNLADKAKEDRGRSIDRLYFVNHIKRPIVTFDSNLFEQFDKDIFGVDGE